MKKQWTDNLVDGERDLELGSQTSSYSSGYLIHLSLATASSQVQAL